MRYLILISGLYLGALNVHSAEPDPDAPAEEGTAATKDGAVSLANEPLSFGFIDNPPGEKFNVGDARLHMHCRGGEVSEQGDRSAVTVIFETGLGGNALEWSPVADALAARVRVCTYDRAGYGWSDPSPRTHDAKSLSLELDLLLRVSGTNGPYIIVAHSFGGLVARLFAEGRDDMAGLVLVDTSHEEQFARLETDGALPMMPRNRQFVISQNEPPETLPRDVRRKMAAFSRMRKSYSATHGEMAAFRQSTDQVRASRQRMQGGFPFPVTVIERGLDLYAGRESGAEKTAVWSELQEDLAMLGRPGRLVVAKGSGHHVHADDPLLVAAEVERLLDLVDGE